MFRKTKTKKNIQTIIKSIIATEGTPGLICCNEGRYKTDPKKQHENKYSVLMANHLTEHHFKRMASTGTSWACF